MTGSRDVGALLIVLGLVYALLYVGWLRRSSKSLSAVGTLSATGATAPAAGQVAGIEGASAAGLRRAPIPARAEGPHMGASIQDTPAETATGPQIGASIQDTPAQTATGPQIGASIQDTPAQTETGAQNQVESQGEAAMPQNGTS